VIWFLKEAVPLFLIGTFCLFLLAEFGVLEKIEMAVRPIVTRCLEWPIEVTQTFIIGFLRRDYAAAGIVDMFNGGALSAVQALVALIVITLFVPCLANMFVIIKEQGVRRALYILMFIFPFAFFVGGVVNFIVRATALVRWIVRV
jgi:ferrous iron transport protein B